MDTQRRELEELEAQATSPSFWEDSNKAKAAIARTNHLKNVLGPFDRMLTEAEEAGILIEMAEAETAEAQQQPLLKEAEGKMDTVEADYRRYELQSLLNERFDENNAYLNINAGAGGTESCDWAQMLFRMYTRYCEEHGFTVGILDLQKGDEAGIKSVSMMVTGPYAYGYMKCERGVHRLVRISPFDSNKRRHTSFAALDVVAEVDDDIEIEINDKDLRVDTYRSSGAGGQHVNRTESAVRFTHLPTGIVVSCQNERSQIKNRATAMKVLKGRLYELELKKFEDRVAAASGEKADVAWGSQIRSYVLQPYQMVKDHRTSHETSQTQKVLDGDLDGFIRAQLLAKTLKAE